MESCLLSTKKQSGHLVAHDYEAFLTVCLLPVATILWEQPNRHLSLSARQSVLIRSDPHSQS